jgi:hypothetical protein
MPQVFRFGVGGRGRRPVLCPAHHPRRRKRRSLPEVSEDGAVLLQNLWIGLVYSRKLDREMLHVRLGSLMDSPSMKPSYHVFVGSKAAWEQIDDDLPKFDAQPERV